MGEHTNRYDAFISYSHVRDMAVAEALQAELQTFARPWYRTRVLRVFRDESNLSASPGLWPELVQALEASSWLVLMASPEAARSPWVQQEVAWWLAHREPDRLLIAWTAGNLVWDSEANDFDWPVTDALPAVLAGVFPAEPRWANLSGLRGISSPDAAVEEPAGQVPDVPLRLGDVVAEFAAPIRGVPKDALVGEHHRQRRRLRRTVVAALATVTTLAVTASAAGVLAYAQRNEARTQTRNATARLLATSSDTMLPTRLDLAQLLAVEAYRLQADRQTEQALFRAVTSSPRLVRYLHAGGEVSALAGAADGTTAVAGTTDGRVLRWSVATGERSELTRLPGRVLSAAISADGATVAATDGQSVSVWTKHRGAISLPGVRRTVPVPTVGNGHLVAVSRSGRYVAVADADSDGGPDTVVLHDLITGKVTRTRVAIGVGDLVMPTDDELVILSSSGQWERRALPQLNQTMLHEHSFMGAHGFNPVISPSGTFFTFDHGAGTLPIWKTGPNPDADRPDLTGLSHGTSPTAAALSPDGSRVAVIDAGTAYVSKTAQQRAEVVGQTALPGNMTTIPDGLEFIGDSDHLLMASGSALVMWDLKQSTRIGQLSPINVPWGCSACSAPTIDISPDGKLAAVVNAEGKVATVQELRGGGLTGSIDAGQGLFSPYTLLGWDADGKRLLVGVDYAGEVEFRRAAPGLPLVGRWPARSDGYRPTELTPDRRGVVERNNTGQIRIRDVQTGEVHPVPPPDSSHAVPYRGTSFALEQADGGTNKIVATDLGTGRSHTVGTGHVVAAKAGRDNVVIQRDSGVLEIWDAAGTKLDSSLRQDSSFLLVSDTSKPAVGGFLVAQQRTDRSIALTDIRDGEMLGTLEISESTSSLLTALTFTPDARKLVTVTESATASGPGVLIEWDLSADRWIRAACDSAGRDLTPDEWRRFVGTDPPADLRCAR